MLAWCLVSMGAHRRLGGDDGHVELTAAGLGAAQEPLRGSRCEGDARVVRMAP